MPLQFVARARQHEHEKKVGHVGDDRLGLADADGFHEDDVETCGFADQHRLARAGGDTAERTGGWRRTDEGVAVGRKPRHARLVPEDRAAGAGRRRVDRQNGDAMAGGGQIRAELVDGGGLAYAGNAGDPDANRISSMRQEPLQ